MEAAHHPANVLLVITDLWCRSIAQNTMIRKKNISCLGALSFTRMTDWKIGFPLGMALLMEIQILLILTLSGAVQLWCK